MNKHKITLVVEGLAERIFVRQLLLTWFQYDSSRIGYDIYCLHAGQLSCVAGTNMSYGSQESEYYFQIIDACNDAQVLSAILNRAKGFVNAGYELIIGLRDMYGEAYKEVENRQVINPTVCEKFIETTTQIIDASPYGQNIRICFAIMEVEAWFLALACVHRYFGINDLSQVRLNQTQCICITDPEQQFYHPYPKLSQIAEAYGRSYHKHEENLEAILSGITKEDITGLYKSSMCASFNTYFNTILPEEAKAEFEEAN